MTAQAPDVPLQRLAALDPQPPHGALRYRPEVDGLRAIAVLSVILYHAGFEAFGGGFVGVDVFFVISGYLITSIIIGEQARGAFSIARFYERRARRIMPALALVMLCCLPVAWLVMMPSQLNSFAQSLVAVSLFASNVLFWMTTGYFDQATEEKPLLHTWSLGVEEQYYLLFPLFVTACWAMGLRRLMLLTGAIALASLGLAEWGGPWALHHPDVGHLLRANWDFYLIPTRAWELLAGSLVAMALFRRELDAWLGRPALEGLGLLGLAMLLVPVFTYSRSTPFPGLYAAVPTFGTAMVIACGRTRTAVARLLSWRGLVGVGLISYSAYLWHQPLLAFLRVWSIAEPSRLAYTLCVLLTLPLAWATWRWVERPFRDPRRLTRRQVFALWALCTAFFGAVGLAGFATKGWAERGSDLFHRIVDARPGDSSDCHDGRTPTQIAAGDHCVLGARGVAPTVAVLGDSHAAALTDALDEQARAAGQAVVMINGPWCAPLLDFGSDENHVIDCRPMQDAALARVAALASVRDVVLVAEWANYTKGQRHDSDPVRYHDAQSGERSLALNPQVFDRAVARTVAYLQRHGKRVTVVKSVPEHRFNVRSVLLKSAWQRRDHVQEIDRTDVAAHRARNHEVEQTFARHGQGVRFVDPAADFCEDDGHCRYADEAGVPYYEDGNHLDFSGASLVVRDLLAALKR